MQYTLFIAFITFVDLKLKANKFLQFGPLVLLLLQAQIYNK